MATIKDPLTEQIEQVRAKGLEVVLDILSDNSKPHNPEQFEALTTAIEMFKTFKG